MSSSITLGKLNNAIITLQNLTAGLSDAQIGSDNVGSVTTLGSATDPTYSRPVAVNTQLIQYENETVSTTTHTIVDPIAYTRRTQQITQANANAAAASAQQQVQSRLNAQAAAVGVPVGDDQGRFMGKFTNIVTPGGNSQNQQGVPYVYEVEVTTSGNIYALCTAYLWSTTQYLYNLDGTPSSTATITGYNTSGIQHVYVIKYNVSGIAQWASIVAFNQLNSIYLTRRSKLMTVSEETDTISIVFMATAYGSSYGSNTQFLSYGSTASTWVNMNSYLGSSNAGILPFYVSITPSSGGGITWGAGNWNTSYTQYSTNWAPPPRVIGICPNYTNSSSYLGCILYCVTTSYLSFGTGVSGSYFPVPGSYISATYYRPYWGSNFSFLPMFYNRTGYNTYHSQWGFMGSLDENYCACIAGPYNSTYGVIVYASGSGAAGTYNNSLCPDRTSFRIVQFADPYNNTGVATIKEILIGTNGGSSQDANWYLGGTIALNHASSTRVQLGGNHLIVCFAWPHNDFNSYRNLDTYGYDSSGNYMQLNTFGVAAITLNTVGNYVYASPLINIRATVTHVSASRFNSSHVVITLRPDMHVMQTIPTTVNIYNLNVAFGSANTYVIAATIPTPVAPYLHLVMDMSTGDLVQYFESDASEFHQFANFRFFASPNVVGMPIDASGVTINVSGGVAYNQYSTDSYGYAGTPFKALTINSSGVTNYTARISAAMTMMNGLNGAIVDSASANGVLAVVGWLNANEKWTVPRLTGQPSSFYIIPTRFYRNSVTNPFIILYSLEDGEVITAGRFLEVDSTTVNVVPTAVVFCPKGQNIFVAFSSTGTATAYRYQSIFNNSSYYEYSDNSTRYSFTLPSSSSGCFVMRGDLTLSSTQLQFTNTTYGGIIFMTSNTQVTTMTVTPSTDMNINEVYMAGYTTLSQLPLYFTGNQTSSTTTTQAAIESYNTARTAFMIKVADTCANNYTSYMTDVHPPALIGGTSEVIPRHIAVSNKGEVCMVGDISAGDVRMQNCVNEWFPYTLDTSGTYMNAITTSSLTNLFDGVPTNTYTAGGSAYFDASGNFVGTANAYGGVWMGFLHRTAYDVPTWLSGVRIVAASPTSTARPRRIKIMYASSDTSGNQVAYTSSADETYVNGVLELSFTPVKCNDAYLVVTHTYNSTTVSIAELRFLGANRWFPLSSREDYSASRPLWGTIAKSSNDVSSCQNPFEYLERTANYWRSDTRNFGVSVNTYDSSGNYTGSDSMGGDWLYFNVEARYGKSRSISSVRIVSSTDNLKPVRFKIQGTVNGGLTTLYTSASDETYTTHYNTSDIGFVEVSFTAAICSDIYVVFTKSGGGNYVRVCGIKFFDTNVTAGSLALSVAADNGFVAKWDSDGRPQLFNVAARATTSTSYTTGVAFDSMSNLYVSGHFTGTVNFMNLATNTTGSTATASGTGTDVFLIKYNSEGATQNAAVVLSGTGNEQDTTIRVAKSGYIYMTGITTSSSATPYNLSNGQTEIGFNALSASSNTPDVFMLVFNSGGVLQNATNLVSTTGNASAVIFEQDKHEGYVLFGNAGAAAGTYKDHLGNTITNGNVSTAGHYMLRVHGGQQKNAVSLLDFNMITTTSSIPIQWCDSQYVHVSDTEKYVYVLVAQLNATGNYIPKLNGGMSTKKYTRNINNNNNEYGLYMIKYDAITGEPLFGDLVTSSPVVIQGSNYPYYNCQPRIKVTTSGYIYIVCTTNARFYNHGSNPTTPVYYAYSLNTSGTNIALPVETYSAQPARVLLMQYDTSGTALMANIVARYNSTSWNTTIHCYHTALTVDSDNNVYVAFVANAFNAVNNAINVYHLNQSRSGGTIFSSTLHNQTAYYNFAPYLMKVSAIGDVQWARLMMNDQFAGNGYYSAIIGLNIANNGYLYASGSSYYYGAYNIFQSNNTVFTTIPAITSYSGNTHWIVKMSTVDSLVIKASRVLYSGVGTNSITSTFMDVSGNIWHNLQFYVYDSSGTATLQLYNLSNSALNSTFGGFNYSSNINMAFAMRLNTSNDNFDRVSRRGLMDTYGAPTAGCADPSGNIYFVMGAGNLNRTNRVLNFDGTTAKYGALTTTGCSSQLASPHTQLIFKYNSSGNYVSHFQYQNNHTTNGCYFATYLPTHDSVLVGITRPTNVTSNGHQYMRESITDSDGQVITVLGNQTTVPLVLWSQNLDSQATASNPINNLKSYATWFTDTLPTPPSVSIGVNTESYGFGIYNTSGSVSIKSMTGIESGLSLPSTAGVSSAYVVKMDVNKTASLASCILTNVTNISAMYMASNTTMVVVAVAAGNVILYNLSGSLATTFGSEGVLTASAGNIITLFYSIGNNTLTAAHVNVMATATSLHQPIYDTYTDSLLIAGTLSVAGTAVAMDGSNYSMTLASGGFIAKFNMTSKALVWAGTILTAGTLKSVGVTTLGKILLVGSGGTGIIGIAGTGTTTYTTATTDNVAVMLDSSGTLVDGVKTSIALVGGAVNDDDEFLLVGSASTAQNITSLSTDMTVGTLTIGSLSTALIWLNRDTTFKSVNTIVTNATPNAIAVDVLGGFYVIGTFTGTINARHGGTGAASASSATATSASDAFLAVYSSDGAVVNLSRLTNTPYTHHRIDVVTTSNTIFLSYVVDGSGTIFDRSGNDVYTVATADPLPIWSHMPLNINTSTVTPIIAIKLPKVPINNMITSKRIILPPGYYQISSTDPNTIPYSEQFYVPPNTLSNVFFNVVMGNWYRLT